MNLINQVIQSFIPSAMRGHERTAENHAIRLKEKRHENFFYQYDTLLPKSLENTRADLMKAKTHTYSPSLIYTHIPMYVSKDKIFILLTSANYGPFYLIDFTNM